MFTIISHTPIYNSGPHWFFSTWQLRARGPGWVNGLGAGVHGLGAGVHGAWWTFRADQPRETARGLHCRGSHLLQLQPLRFFDLSTCSGGCDNILPTLRQPRVSQQICLNA